jgi:uncharacterized protein YidB (DUF937 family)
MGLFDSLAKQALGGILGGGGTSGGLDLGTLMKLASNSDQASGAVSGLLNQVGGISGLLSKFQSAGLGDVAASWVGSGENQAVEPAKIESALGTDVVQGFASKLGLDSAQLLPLLSQFLPVIIDKLTPAGKVEAEQPSADMLQNVIASVLKGGLGGLKA